ncbi:protease complex subunit PrcB family protein [Aequorivita flava]|uniref:Protease complex subunit PrcB family protein n=2 Tax=Aequorivita flava TaxID=3114371 RepID=A0AB35YMR2_9FLAO
MAITLVFSCKPTAYKNSKLQKNISFEVLLSNSQSNIVKQKNVILQTSEELKQIFNSINATRTPHIPIPKVDFKTEIVAFINIGETSTGGHSVAVKEIIEKENTLVVFYEGNSPKPGENATMVITTPFTMVKFKKQPKSIIFKRVVK